MPKYCSVATILQAPGWDCAAHPWDFTFTCPCALPAPWLSRHSLLRRCASCHPCIHIADPEWQQPDRLAKAGDTGDRVLARREPDGFYYWAQIKAAPELQQGTLLVEFEVPLVTDPKLPAPWLSVVSEEDVILLPSVECTLRTGDKVLAPWGPKQQRYGPGTILLGLERTDAQSAKEEIAVLFWNGMTAKVPRDGLRPVSPAVWKKAVERLHPRPLLWTPCCSLLGPATGYSTSGFPLGTQAHCPASPPHTCCQLLCQGGLCCSPLGSPTWWPLTRRSEATTRELAESELMSATQLLPLGSPKEKTAAVRVPVAASSSSSSLSSSSSSSTEEDLHVDLEMSLPQTVMVNSAVNTEPVFLEKPRKQAALCQPEWRYWRRRGPEPRPGKPGARSCNIQQKEDNKQHRVQTVVMGTAKELTRRALHVKPSQILPEEAAPRRPSEGTHHRDKN